MEKSLDYRVGKDLAHGIEGEQSECRFEPVAAEADQGDRQEGEVEAEHSRDDVGENNQVLGDDNCNEVDSASTVEEDTRMLETAAMDPAEDINAGRENHQREHAVVVEEVVAEEPGADSTFENEAAIEKSADAKIPDDERNVLSVSKRKRIKSFEDETPAGLPVTRVKRIIKLDPDIRLVSKEGIFTIIQATQYFLEALALESMSQAWKSKRKGVKADDIVVAARSSKFRDCLGTTLSDFLQGLREEESDDENGESADESEREDLAASSKKGNRRDVKRKFSHPPPGNRSITDFLKVAG